MTVAIAQIAKELTMTRSELERRSLEAFIERERRLVNLDIADLQDRYGVRTARDLANHIEIKAVYSHPAWEETIEWERLEAYLQRLNQWQAELNQPCTINWLASLARSLAGSSTAAKPSDDGRASR